MDKGSNYYSEFFTNSNIEAGITKAAAVTNACLRNPGDSIRNSAGLVLEYIRRIAQ
jgi:hypothetical protein